MTSEVEWVLDQFGGVAGSLTTPLTRVNRDDSDQLDGDIHTREADLQTANFVGARLADRSGTPIGTEYDHALETVVGVRVEGLHHSQFGHVDPDSAEGIAFSDLVERLRDAVLAKRTFPDAAPTDSAYTDLRLQNETPQSATYRDYYRYDFDVVFSGFETLP